MIQTLTRNWWLLALCAAFEAIIAAIYFNHAGQGFGLKSTIVLLGGLTLIAGACTIVAGIGSSAQVKSWLLVVNGLAFAILGLILIGIFGSRISILIVSLLIIVTAVSFGILELLLARLLRRQRHGADGWFFELAGMASIGFALAFLALGLRWIKIGPGSHPDLLWLGSYFGFSAVCMLWLALRLHSRGISQSGAKVVMQ